jgi:hypothetical protein
VHSALPSAVQDLTYSEVKPDITVETKELVNIITVKYAYDYINQEYQNTYTYPPTAASNPSYRKYGKEVEKTIYCPGIYTAEKAEYAAQRLFEQYADGMSLLTVNCDLRALLYKMGEQWDIDINDPDVVGRFEIIKKSISIIGNRNVALSGYNTAMFDKFGMPDTAMAEVSCAW